MRSVTLWAALALALIAAACGSSPSSDVPDSGVVDNPPPPPCPLGTSRACYSGAASTQDHGSCHSGTQQCSADGWGPCEGEVTPALESCNGLDDDCDDQTDEGCPVTGALSLSPYSQTGSFFGNSTGNSTTNTRSKCPEGTVVRGFIGAATETFDRLGLACASVTLTADESTKPFTYSLELADAGTVAPIGGVGGTDFGEALSCPPNQVVTAISAWDDAQTASCSASACTGGANSSTCAGLYGLQISCSSLELVGAPGSYVIQAKAGATSSNRVATGNASRPVTVSTWAVPLGSVPVAADFASGPWPVYCAFTTVNGVRLLDSELLVETK